MKFLFSIFLTVIPLISYCSIQDLAFKSDFLTVNPISVPYNEIDNYPAKQQWKQEFLNRYGNQWGIIIDLRSGTPVHIFGQGIPFFPGLGNELPFQGEVTESEVVNSVMEFLNLHSALFNINPQIWGHNTYFFCKKPWLTSGTRNKYVSHVRLALCEMMMGGWEPAFAKQQLRRGTFLYLRTKSWRRGLVSTKPCAKSDGIRAEFTLDQ
ncbi:MAG TPA: hypothetical protein PK014_06050 [Thermoanaerobaculia bacterium]|nr:hypothetical protein [Thermoanaerobaculia bacterium]HUM29659.1 hypothetical protein [Thermoanaerobaculia bacterium]HXK67310.1 hypothetical protein [Thermoanaerobaculia bacterium]